MKLIQITYGDVIVQYGNIPNWVIRRTSGMHSIGY